ncbi:MAG: GNAT family N-acetyltransferase [Halochromatium sp.]|nr:GNAT family N-acetyltransferase [Halochromatium sp.]
MISATNERWPQRELILLEGERDRGLQVATELIAKRKSERPIWVSNAPIPDAIPPAKRQQLLGGECDLLILDLWSGLDADTLGAAVGSLRGGGLLLLLTPALADWPSQIDPEAARLATYPYSAAEVGTRFIGRLARLLQPFARAPGVKQPNLEQPNAEAGIDYGHPSLLRQRAQQTAATQGRPAADQPSLIGRLFTGEPTSSRSSAQPATPDQAEAIAAICALAAGRARRPLVITADRGRGKSAALGIAAGQLIATRRLRIIVTAPRRSAVETLFAHADARLQADSTTALKAALDDSPNCWPDRSPDCSPDCWPDRSPDGSPDCWPDPSPDCSQESSPKAAQEGAPKNLPRFLAPDALLASPAPADLLLVDEAAGLPAPLLEALLMRYPRVCFATTVHGYEGSGRGFDIRFRALLDQRTPGWRALRLHSPIRWRQGDRVEQWINQLLLLDAEPATDAQVAAADLSAAGFRLHERDALASDEPLLRQLFGLLVLGHYQTRPNDLRHLLDGPNLEVATLSVGGLVLATALIAREGRLEPALLQPIFEGRRRPHGHLLPQTLSAHAGLIEAPSLGFARILRIAVHPAARRRGLGQRLIRSLAARARADGIDLFGASFGANADLLAFWRHCGLLPIHLGTHRNAASGTRAAVVLQALSPAGADLIEQARKRLERDLPILLTGPLQEAEPALVAALLEVLSPQAAVIDPRDQQQIDAFASAHRTLEAALPALERLVRQRLAGASKNSLASGLSWQQRDLLILSILQRRHAEAVITALGLSGRAVLLQQLRGAIAALQARGDSIEQRVLAEMTTKGMSASP